MCTSCDAWQRVLDGRECVDCHDGWWPTPDKQSCYRLPQRYIAWSSPYAVAPCVMACLGIALTSVVMATFVRHIDTPVVRAAGRELCFLLLSGFLLIGLVGLATATRGGPPAVEAGP